MIIRRRHTGAPIKAKDIPLSEHAIQATLVAILEHKLRPGVVMFSVPNGGLRQMRVAIKLKSEGSAAGMPDLGFAFEGGRVIWLEIKNAKGRLSDVQIGMHQKLKNLGHVVGLAKSVDEALIFLGTHGLFARAA